MASTVAMYSALSGLNANARSLDVIGNNIANVNTTAYKSNRLLFSNMFSETFSIGTAPGDTTGGTNPTQIGLGVAIAGTQRNFTGGTVSPTGDSRDLAIQGDGFFVVDAGGRQAYTRAGAFRTNSQHNIVNVSGDQLLGYGVDSNFNINAGVLVPLNVPVGSLTLAQATTNVHMSGNLNADGPLPTRGSRTEIVGQVPSVGLRAIPGAVPPPAPGEQISLDTRLVDIEDPQLPLSGMSLFRVGETIQLAGAERGTKTLAPAELAVTPTATVQDFLNFLNDATGIQQTGGPNPDGRTPGVSLEPHLGIITVDGNTGTANNLRIESSDIRILDDQGDFARTAFETEQKQSADGESVSTTYVVYDSLGAPVEVDLAMVLDSKTNAGTTWRYYLDSSENSGTSIALGTGTIAFDTSGQLTTTEPVQVSVDLDDTGAASPLVFEMAFASGQDSVTALADTDSSIAATYRDGSPIGTLTTYGVGQDGIITGVFSNGLTRTLGQVVLATFANNEGLVDVGNNLFEVGPNSGTPVVTPPQQMGAGAIVGGALELSNVDLSAEFIGLIQASTGFSANSRVIQTCNDLFQQLLVLGR